MHQRISWIVRPKRIEYVVGCYGRRQSDRSTRQRLAQANDIGHDIGLLDCKHAAGASKPSG